MADFRLDVWGNEGGIANFYSMHFSFVQIKFHCEFSTEWHDIQASSVFSCVEWSSRSFLSFFESLVRLLYRLLQRVFLKKAKPRSCHRYGFYSFRGRLQSSISLDMMDDTRLLSIRLNSISIFSLQGPKLALAKSHRLSTAVPASFLIPSASWLKEFFDTPQIPKPSLFLLQSMFMNVP